MQRAVIPSGSGQGPLGILLWTWLSHPWYLLVLASYVGWLLPVAPVPPIPVMLASHAQMPSTTWNEVTATFIIAARMAC